MTITKTANLPVSPDEAFILITEPERLRRWLGVTATVDLRAGGSYRWTVTPGHIMKGTFSEVDPGKRIVFGWGQAGNDDLPTDSTTVTITVEPAGTGSLVTLVHEGLNSEQEINHAEGWEHFLGRLEKLATTGDAGIDDWNGVPNPMTPLSAAEASLAVLQPILRNLTREDQTRQTPCADYDGHALAQHLFGSLIGVGGMVGAEVSVPEGGSLEDKVSTMASTVLEKMHERGIDGDVTGPVGPMPAVIATHILSIEFLIHGWDFAQTSGQTITAADELVAYVHEQAEQIINGSRERGAFAAEAVASVDATALDRFAAFSGRALASA